MSPASLSGGLKFTQSAVGIYPRLLERRGSFFEAGSQYAERNLLPLGGKDVERVFNGKKI